MAAALHHLTKPPDHAVTNFWAQLDEIRLGEIVRLFEQDQALVECFAPEGGDCSIDGCCRLKSRLRRAEARFLDEMNQSTRADIALPTQAAA